MKYCCLNNLTELNEILQAEEKIAFLAGGTDLIVKYKRQQASGDLIIDLKKLNELNEWENNEDEIRIGALTTPAQLIAKTQLEPELAALREAAALMASPQIRNRATVGGNIGNASPAGDLNVALMAAGAIVHYFHSNEQKTIALEDCFSGPGKTNLPRYSVITAVSLPKRNNRVGSGFEKLGMRKTHEIAIVNGAVMMTVEQENEKINDLRLALGAVGPKPLLLQATASFIIKLNRPMPGWTDEDWENINSLVHQEISPIADLRASAEYRRDMAFVLLKRALLKAYDRATKGGN